MKLEKGEHISINGTYGCYLSNNIAKEGNSYGVAVYPYLPGKKTPCYIDFINFLTLFGLTKKYKSISGTNWEANHEEKLDFMKEVLKMFNELFVARKTRFTLMDVRTDDNDELYMDVFIDNDELLECIDKSRISPSPRYKNEKILTITGDYCLDVIFDAIEKMILNKKKETTSTL